MITKTACIAKTHYGLKIFSYILRQFDANLVLKFGDQYSVRPSRKDSTPPMVYHGVNHLANHSTYFVNPFIQGSEPSLFIYIENQVAVYQDIHTPSFCGDVFDFAQLYFKEDSEQQLLIRINQELCLGLLPQISSYEEHRQRMQQALDQIPDNHSNPISVSYTHLTLPTKA